MFFQGKNTKFLKRDKASISIAMHYYQIGGTSSTEGENCIENMYIYLSCIGLSHYMQIRNPLMTLIILDFTCFRKGFLPSEVHSQNKEQGMLLLTPWSTPFGNSSCIIHVDAPFCPDYCVYFILGLGPICDEFRIWALNFVRLCYLFTLSSL